MIVTRKLNQVRNSFYVYLPRDWCERYSLDKNSEVRIQSTDEGALLIHPPNYEPRTVRSFEFSIASKEQGYLESILTGGYIVGAQDITITFPETIDMDTRERMSRWTRRLPGYEILDEHSDSIHVSDTSEKQVIGPILKRQFSTTKYMLRVLTIAIEDGDLDEVSRLEDRDEDVDRHRYFVERLCHLALIDSTYARKIDIKPSDCLHFSLAAKYVERIADHICGAAEQLIKVESVNEKTKRASKKLLSAYDDMMSTFFSIESSKKRTSSHDDLDKIAFDVLNRATAIAEELAHMESSKKTTNPHMVLLFMHLDRIASYCADIGEVAINRIIGSRIEDGSVIDPR